MMKRIYDSIKVNRLPCNTCRKAVAFIISGKSRHLSDLQSFLFCGIINQRGCNEN